VTQRPTGDPHDLYRSNVKIEKKNLQVFMEVLQFYVNEIQTWTKVLTHWGIW